MSKLSSIGQKVRYEVLNRDGHQCTECGSRHELQVHYNSYPEIDTVNNLITLYRSYHRITHVNNPEIVTENHKSSVAVERETRLELDSMGYRNETYDQIIRRLIKFYKENQPKEGKRQKEMTTKPIPRSLTVQLIKTHGILCQNCKMNEFDDIHHIDKDPSNNSFDNLMLLCFKCHREKHSSSKFLLSENYIVNDDRVIKQRSLVE